MNQKRMIRVDKSILIHEVHDMWPATLIELGGMNKFNPFVVLLQMAENSAYKHSDAVVSILPNAEEYMIEHGLRDNKFYYIPNGVVLSDWENPEPLPGEVENEIKALKEKGCFLIGYFGGHSPVYALDTLLDAARILLDDQTYSHLRIVLVGDGNAKNKLVQRIKDECITNVLTFDSVNKKSIPNLLDYFDCIYMGTTDSTLYRFGFGYNKAYDAMMSGKPVVLSTNAKNTVIEAEGCGIIVGACDASEVAKAIIRMSEMSHDERSVIGKRGKRSVKEKYTYDKLAPIFESLWDDSDKKKRILLINHYAGSVDMGMEFRPFYFAREWVKSGNRVDIIAADYSHLRTKNPDTKKDFDEDIIDGIHYHWIHTGKYEGNGVKRAISMFEFVGKIVLNAERISQALEPDVIITSSTYPLDTYAGQIIRRVRRSE